MYIIYTVLLFICTQDSMAAIEAKFHVVPVFLKVSRKCCFDDE